MKTSSFLAFEIELPTRVFFFVLQPHWVQSLLLPSLQLDGKRKNLSICFPQPNKFRPGKRKQFPVHPFHSPSASLPAPANLPHPPFLFSSSIPIVHVSPFLFPAPANALTDSSLTLSPPCAAAAAIAAAAAQRRASVLVLSRGGGNRGLLVGGDYVHDYSPTFFSNSVASRLHTAVAFFETEQNSKKKKEKKNYYNCALNERKAAAASSNCKPQHTIT